MNLRFTIPEKVQAKQSARFYTDDFGKIKSYQPQRVKDFTNKVQLYFREQCEGHRIEFFNNVPLRVQILVYINCPKSWSEVRKNKAEYGEIRPIVKPDCDNICKIILDSLNKLAYPDDRQIVELQVKKYYSSYERIEVRIGKI